MIFYVNELLFNLSSRARFVVQNQYMVYLKPFSYTIEASLVHSTLTSHQTNLVSSCKDLIYAHKIVPIPIHMELEEKELKSHFSWTNALIYGKSFNSTKCSPPLCVYQTKQFENDFLLIYHIQYRLICLLFFIIISVKSCYQTCVITYRVYSYQSVY